MTEAAAIQKAIEDSQTYPKQGRYVLLLVNPTAALTNAPAAGTEVPGQQSRAVLDLRGIATCQVQALFSVIPPAAGTCRVEYSVNGGTNWATLADSSSPHVANVLKAGVITPVPPEAKVTSCLLRVVVTGDGVADPVLQKAAVSFLS